MPSTMKAVRIHGRGGPEFLKYEDAPIPRHPASSTYAKETRFMVSRTFLVTALRRNMWPSVLPTSPLNQNPSIMLAPLQLR
jgi:hypothetical protein